MHLDHAIESGSTKVMVLSPDTDVLELMLYDMIPHERPEIVVY